MHNRGDPNKKGPPSGAPNRLLGTWLLIFLGIMALMLLKDCTSR